MRLLKRLLDKLFSQATRDAIAAYLTREIRHTGMVLLAVTAAAALAEISAVEDWLAGERTFGEIEWYGMAANIGRAAGTALVLAVKNALTTIINVTKQPDDSNV